MVKLTHSAGLVVPLAILTVACSSPVEPTRAPTPVVAGPAPPVVIRAVAVAGLAGRGSSVTPGETVQFTATATFSDEHVEDCTGTAAWSSSDENVIRLTPRPGEMRTIATGDAIVSATCTGTTGTQAVKVAVGVRVVGLESYVPFMLTTETQQLRAYVVNAPGSLEDCTLEAVWTSSNPEVGRFTFRDPGLLDARGPGEAIITADCDGIAGHVPLQVDYYSLEGTVYSSETAAPVPDVALNWNFGVQARSDASGRYSAIQQNTSPRTWRAWKVGWDTTLQTVSWDRQPLVRMDWSLAAVPGIFLQGSDRLCRKTSTCQSDVPRERVYAFTVPAAGTLRLDTFWDGDYNDHLEHELHCNGTLVLKGSDGLGNHGKRFETAASPACDYELKFTYNASSSLVTYEYTISFR